MMAQSVNAQFTVRNDFIINAKDRKIRNSGITFLSIHLDRHPNLNGLISGRGGNTLRIDVNALKYPKRKYSYEQIAEKIYVPNVTTSMLNAVPLFLLIAPKRK